MLANFYVKPAQQVQFAADPKRLGSILRVYPFTDRANIMVKWHDGVIRSYFQSELSLPQAARQNH